MKLDNTLAHWLAMQRPALFRYCSRLTGSVADGEDAVQDTMMKSMQSFPGFDALSEPTAWLFRVAHNASMDILRARSKSADVLSEDYAEVLVDPHASGDTQWVTRSALRHFMWLTPTERSCVALMDVLEYSIQEVAEITGKSTLAVKSALHRGRTRLKEISDSPEGLDLPPLNPSEQLLLDLYAERFNARDFDGVRALLSDDVRLDLVGRTKLQGKAPVSGYFNRYSSTDDWKFVPGLIEGQPAIVALDLHDPLVAPMYFILLRFEAGKVSDIRDFRYARYACEAIDLLSTSPTTHRAN